MVTSFRGPSFKRLPKSSHDGGATLLEVVIVVVVLGLFLTVAYQFLLLTNAKTRSQITDQVFNDRVNIFFATIAKDFRTAREMAYTEQGENISITLKTTDGKTITYAVKNDEKRILRNNTEVIKGVTTKIALDGQERLNIMVKNKAKGPSGSEDYDYVLSVMRRNKLKVTK